MLFDKIFHHWHSELPRLIWRALRHRGKRSFLQSLITTYYCNYINLALAFHGSRSQHELRRIARATVWTYVRNAACYLIPRAWGGFRVENLTALTTSLAHGRGVVVAAQHLGPQRFLLLELARVSQKVHVTITEQFWQRLRSWLDRVQQDAHNPEDARLAQRIELLRAEDPTCALKMVRALKRGEVVCFDVDGNLGVGREEKTLQEALTLPFLGQEVHVRSGVAYLSYRTGAPIVPVISLWARSGRPTLHFFDPLQVHAGETRESFTERALGSVYRLLEGTLVEHPEQWEMWPFFYKWISPREKCEDQANFQHHLRQILADYQAALTQNPATPLRVDPRDAFVLRVRGRWVLIDRRHFRFFVTAKSSGAVLRQLHQGTTLEQLIRNLSHQLAPETTFRELARLRLLGLVQSPTAA